jgi:hypothetical protein
VLVLARVVRAGSIAGGEAHFSFLSLLLPFLVQRHLLHDNDKTYDAAHAHASNCAQYKKEAKKNSFIYYSAASESGPKSPLKVH